MLPVPLAQTKAEGALYLAGTTEKWHSLPRHPSIIDRNAALPLALHVC